MCAVVVYVKLSVHKLCYVIVCVLMVLRVVLVHVIGLNCSD